MSVLTRNNVTITGAGRQAMIFAHGFGCDQHMWRFVAPAFADTYRLVLFDHVGAGASDLSAYRPEKYATLAGYADDVLEICDALDLSDAIFVGHSVSAMIGLLATIKQPERFAALILIGPSPCYIDDRDYIGGFTRPDIEELLDTLESNYLGWSHAMAPVIMGAPEQPALATELAESFCRTDPAIARQFARVTFLSDNRADLPLVQTPCLILQCAEDVIAPQAVGAYVHRHLAGSHLATLDATGHCPPSERAGGDHRRDAPVPGRAMTDKAPRRPAIDDALLYESADDLYEHAPCGYLSTTPDGLIVKVNQTFLTWSGYGRDELVGQRRFAELLRVGGKLYYETHVAPLLQMHGVANEIAFDLVRKDGRPLPALVSALLRRDERGRPVVQRMTVFNATERRQYEQEVLWAKRTAEQAAADLRQMLAVLPVAVVIVGADGRIVEANTAARELAGYAGTTPEGEGAVVEDLWLRHPDGSPYPLQELPVQRSLHAGDVVRGREAHIRQVGSGRLVAVLASSAPLYSATGTIAGAVAVYQDVTPLKDLERAREEFLGAAAHDLKTPLTSVQGLAQLARRRLARLMLPEAAPVTQALDGIDASTQRMARLIDELMDITRLQMGTLLELCRQPTDLVALARAVVAQQRGVSGHQLVVKATLPELVVALDATRIERVLSNLIGNAIKYSPAGGEISVRVSQEDDEATAWAVVAVRDTGLGIPPADLPHIFERYFRAGNVRGRVPGTGIGLASVRQIVEQHGGHVTVQSQEGVGTTVIVRLPRRVGSAG